jgi:hypothetical protein
LLYCRNWQLASSKRQKAKYDQQQKAGNQNYERDRKHRELYNMWNNLPHIIIYISLHLMAIHAFSHPTKGVIRYTSSSSSSSSSSCTRLYLFKGENNKNSSNKSTRPIQFETSKNKNKGNIFDSIFTGGAFEDTPSEEILSSASSIASKIKSVKDLGWTKPPKRRGNARPRHRAWGGEGEMAIQDKANYDETRENCVEKWLTMEDFLRATRAPPGPAADTVFVALAGGAKYAEREICEMKIAQWTGQGKTTAKENNKKQKTLVAFDQDAFRRTVKEGRQDLLLGWVSFLSVNLFFASCIAFPTNPAAKALEGFIENLKEQAL